jgi:diguanylate cyclase (GGDEF)-like protein
MMRVTSFELERASYFVISHQNITERKVAEIALAEQSRQLEALALYDALTGLGNRNLFLKQLEHLIAISGRRKEQIALLSMDLDGFKEVNDRLGHAAGDEVLREFSTRLRQVLREADQKYRIGGDEFVVLLEPRSESLDGALTAAEKIARAAAVPMKIKGRDCVIGVSIGVAVFPQHGEDPHMLIRKADAAMYEAKKTRQVISAASDLDATAVLKRLQSAI